MKNIQCSTSIFNFYFQPNLKYAKEKNAIDKHKLININKTNVVLNKTNLL